MEEWLWVGEELMLFKSSEVKSQMRDEFISVCVCQILRQNLKSFPAQILPAFEILPQNLLEYYYNGNLSGSASFMIP